MPITEDTEITELIADVGEQVRYLQELGVDSLSIELTSLGDRANPTLAPTAENTEEIISNLRSEISKPAPYPAGSRLASLPKLSVPPVPRVPGGTEETLFETAPALPEPTETIEQIRAEIGPLCTRCALHSMGRSQVVNSVGNFNADLMF